MNNENHHPNDQLIDALLQEQSRSDREQQMQAIQDAIAPSAKNATEIDARKRRSLWPWGVGLAASAALATGYFNSFFSPQKSQIVATKNAIAEESRKNTLPTNSENPSVPPPAQKASAVSTETQTDQIKKNLYAGEGYYQLGKFDAANNQFQSVLRLDPYNSEARRGLERVSAAKNQYYKAAYDHTRADLLAEVDKSWELPAPRDEASSVLQPTPQVQQVAGNGASVSPPAAIGGGGSDALAKNIPTPAQIPVFGGLYRDLSKATRAANLDAADKQIAPSHFGRVNGMSADAMAQGNRYGALIDPGWKSPRDEALSTFSVDVDNASYSNIRRAILEGRDVHPDSVRIEECINAFHYSYAPPTNQDAFAVHQSLATCPWNEQHALLRIGIKGREIEHSQRPASNLVFLIDVSGSMQSSDKLPLVKDSLKLLLGRLDERDSVSYVVYAGSEGVALSPTRMDEKGRTKAIKALSKLESGGSTNGGAGIKRAYTIAAEQFRKDGVNRVILCSDGDFNVGVTGTKQLVSLVKERAAANIYLSVLSFGTGNLNDEMLETISRDGNGNHYYIDSLKEAQRVFLQKLSGTLITIAKDVKLQLEFNPARVASYRLIGYANRQLRNEDFHNDRVDAGDIGAGHEVTAFYEIIPAGGIAPSPETVLKYQTPPTPPAPTDNAEKKFADEWLTLKLRHKHPEGEKSALQEHVLAGSVQAFQKCDSDYRFATAVAMFGMKLRHDSHLPSTSWQAIREIASDSLGTSTQDNRVEFLDLIRKLAD